MTILESLFGKRDPQTQLRKCNALIRLNDRRLDREIATLKQTELKIKNLILQADKRSLKNKQHQVQAQQEMRMYAGELIRVKKSLARLATSKAQLNSVQLQMNEAFATRKIEGTLRTSVGIMSSVNYLNRLPQLADTMKSLSSELVKAGIIEEMVDDVLPQDSLLDEGEDEAADQEIDQVLAQIFKTKISSIQNQDYKQQQEQEEVDDIEAVMDQMSKKLEAAVGN